jgi:hypothetical protein
MSAAHAIVRPPARVMNSRHLIRQICGPQWSRATSLRDDSTIQARGD